MQRGLAAFTAARATFQTCTPMSSAAAASPCLPRGARGGIILRGARHSRRAPVERRVGKQFADVDARKGEKLAIIIVDHGSRRQASNLLLVGEKIELSYLLLSARLPLSTPSYLPFLHCRYFVKLTPTPCFRQLAGGVREDVSRRDGATHR
jgi:hypothetical protein